MMKNRTKRQISCSQGACIESSEVKSYIDIIFQVKIENMMCLTKSLNCSPSYVAAQPHVTPASKKSCHSQ